MKNENRLDMLIMSADKDFIARASVVCEELAFVFRIVDKIDILLENESEFSQTTFVLYDGTKLSQDMIVGDVQVLKQMCPAASIMAVANGKMNPSQISFLKKSGANLVVLENEYFHTSKFEYIATQTILTSYVPVKPTDIVKGKTAPCLIYHMLPLNRKYLPVLVEGQEISESKVSKIAEVGEVYIKKSDVDKFAAYAATIEDKSAAGLTRRCRMEYLKLVNSFNDLVFLLTDQAEYASFDTGKKIYERCRELASNLLVGLSSIGDPWDVINNASTGGFGSVDRAPAIAAYAGLLSLQSSIGESVDVMICAMIADIGLLDMNPKASKKMRQDNFAGLNAEEIADYEKHPIISLNQALSRKLQISDLMKSIILATHERNDGKGFPHKLKIQKIPEEAMLIQICELVDRDTIVKMGKERKNVKNVRNEVYKSQEKETTIFPLTFLLKIKEGFVS